VSQFVKMSDNRSAFLIAVSEIRIDDNVVLTNIRYLYSLV